MGLVDTKATVGDRKGRKEGCRSGETGKEAGNNVGTGSTDQASASVWRRVSPESIF